MQTQSGALSFNVVANDINFKSTLDQIERRVMGFSGGVVRETNKIDDSFRRLGQLAAGYFSLQALSDLPGQILRVRSEFQALELAFGVMLKSKTKADTLLASLAETAASTPFGLKDIAGGAKQLLAYGSASENVVKEIRMLGDVASGVSAPINELIYLYGTLRTQGRAYATDIRQFAGRGIPIYAELAKVLGVNVDQVNKFVESGKVGFKEVEQAFKNMTSSGGLFAGLMDAQSKSLLGLKERLSDAWDLMLNEIGKKNQDVAAQLFETATGVVDHYQDVIDVLKVVVTVYGSYRAALLLVTTAQRANLIFTQTMALQQGLASLSGTTLTATQLRLAASTSLLSRAQAALNATMLANPYVLVGTALAALVTYVVLFEDETKKLKSSQEILAGANQEAISSFNRQRGEVTTLIGVIRNQNIAESERLKAYDKLKSVAPDIVAGLDFQKAKTMDLTSAVNQYLVALRKRLQLEAGQNKAKEAYDQQTEAAEKLKKAEDAVIASRGKNQRFVVGVGDVNGPTLARSAAQQAQADLDEAQKIKQKADQVVGQVETAISNIYAGTSSKQEIEANISRQERLMASLDKLSPAYKVAETSLNGFKAQLAGTVKRGNQAQKRESEHGQLRQTER
jgi:tape measure domain-containing protein